MRLLMRRLLWVFPTLLVVAALLATSSAEVAAETAAPTYSITNLGNPFGRSRCQYCYVNAGGINDLGQVVGVWRDTSLDANPLHAFIWQDGTMRDLGGLPGGIYPSASAVNIFGLVAGSDLIPGSGSRAFLWFDGLIFDLDSFDGYNGSSAAINDFGQVVGWAHTPAGMEPLPWSRTTV